MTNLLEHVIESSHVDGLTRCGHANVFGCPNHGDFARALVSPLRRKVVANYEQQSLLFVPRECWPIPFLLTERGRLAAFTCDSEFVPGEPPK